MRALGTLFAFVLAFTLGVASASSAATLEGVTLPASSQVDGHTLALNGMGLRSKLMFKVYVAGLYVEHPTRDADALLRADEPKRMVLQFLRNVSRQQMVDAYTEAFERNTPSAAATLSKEIQRLMDAFEPVSAGDQMVFTYAPGRGTTLSIKGRDKVTIPGLPFGEAMFACWLGPNPPSGDFKRGLLGR